MLYRLSLKLLLVATSFRTIVAFTQPSRYYLRLPRTESSPRRPLVQPKRLVYRVLYSATGNDATDLNGRKRRVLLVDDEDSIRHAVGQILSENGYQVTTCEDGISALEYFVSKTPDAVVSDVRMPGMDGLELLAKLREASPTIPVILLTAKGMPKDRVAGYQAGADAYVPKPFDPEELVAILDSVIERHEQLNSDVVSVGDLQRDVDDIKRLLLSRGVGRQIDAEDVVFLTPDERRVLELLSDGLINKDISQQLFLSTRRVEQLLTTMYRKAKVKNRTELVRWAISTGNVKL